MRKEKHRSVGASGFFLDRPGEARGWQAGHLQLQRAQHPPAPWLLKAPHPCPPKSDRSGKGVSPQTQAGPISPLHFSQSSVPEEEGVCWGR